ncbi:MAG: DUF5103 domain-containing protein [Chitinophagaceae bacterium]|nr:MAG: DUF5103 domain-containing protein [Chitinophagaceae bacterium]
MFVLTITIVRKSKLFRIFMAGFTHFSQYCNALLNKLTGMKTILTSFLVLLFTAGHSQIPDQVYMPDIRTVTLTRAGDALSYPILTLNSGDQLQLDFDDLAGGYKNLYYTFLLCNTDWSVSNLPSFDYIKGFQSTRITNYRNSSISEIPYTHYQATIPDRSSVPSRSGNYMLKVFRNNDTADLLFTKRFLVVDSRVSIAAQIKQPFNSQYFLTDQRVQVVVNTANARINTMSPQDLKIVVLQNNIWNTAAMVDRPGIYRGNYFEYNDDQTSFPSGREWRWIDLRSLRLLSDRMDRIVDTARRTDVYVRPESQRSQQVYFYYRDQNGRYVIENTDGNNPLWQSDYAYVHFTFAPPGGRAFAGKDLYVFGELTNYRADDNSRMIYNADKGVYESTLYLKQGYYNYSYVIADSRNPVLNRFSLDNTEGNFTNTENVYTVLVYYRGFGSRSDELLGYTTVSSMIAR